MSKKETCDFWVGYFPDQDSFLEYFGETNEEDDDIPISKFAEDQNETWYDQDLAEMNFVDDVADVQKLVEDCSYSEQFSTQLAEKLKVLCVGKVNFVAYIEAGQIKQPVSIQGDLYRVTYIGQISFDV